MDFEFLKLEVKGWFSGRGGGQVVSVLAFFSDDPSSNPAEAYSFSVNLVFEKNENTQKRPGLVYREWHMEVANKLELDFSWNFKRKQETS